MNSQAGIYAERFGFKNLSEQGRGREFNDTLLTTAFKRIAQGGLESRNSAGANMINNGMQFSGAAEVKIPNMVTGDMASQAFDAMNQVSSDDQNFKLDMASKWVNILSHEDNYNLQKEQIEFQRQQAQGDFLDTLMRVGSVVSSIASVIPGAGTAASIAGGLAGASGRSSDGGHSGAVPKP